MLRVFRTPLSGDRCICPVVRRRPGSFAFTLRSQVPRHLNSGSHPWCSGRLCARGCGCLSLELWPRFVAVARPMCVNDSQRSHGFDQAISWSDTSCLECGRFRLVLLSSLSVTTDHGEEQEGVFGKRFVRGSMVPTPTHRSFGHGGQGAILPPPRRRVQVGPMTVLRTNSLQNPASKGSPRSPICQSRSRRTCG